MIRQSTQRAGARTFGLVLVAGLVCAACGTPAPRAISSTTSPSLTTAVTTTTLALAPTTTAPEGAIVEGPGAMAHYQIQPQPGAGTCHYSFSGQFPLPDPRCTPGALNPAVTQATLSTTICSSGYSTRIRPPESVTGPEKIGSARAYGYTGSLHTAEYDHLISLELGGDPNDPANLWVEPNDRAGARSTFNSKDTLEDKLHSLLCTGRLSLATAQRAIAGNWAAAYDTYVLGRSPAARPDETPVVQAPAPAPGSVSSGGCSPLTPSGGCYRAGEFCSSAEHGATGTNEAGDAISCVWDGSRWRWE